MDIQNGLNKMKKISELKLETIQLEDQVLLVEKNREYQTNGWAFNTGKGVFWVDMSDRYPSGYKFIASTKPLEGLPLLVIEDEVEILAEHSSEVQEATYTPPHKTTYKHGFMDGYNKAKETFKFTEEDLRKAIQIARHTLEYDERWGWYETKTEQEIIQSLTKKELWIEVELSLIKENRKTGYTVEKLVPKIVNNQIKAVWKN